jgi:3alpha(or 20beta)-hydroxysteroid dehydrogenase
MARFDGEVVLVTGGAQGMGANHARHLVAEGAHVLIGDVAVKDGEALAAELGEPAKFVRLDVTDDQSWTDAVAFGEEAFGPFTALINNAGISAVTPWLDLSTADFRRMMDINTTGQFIGIRTIVPSLRRSGKGGAIVNISSTAGIAPSAGTAPYSASKWAVRGLTKVAALEFAADNIRVVSVHPGFVETQMTEGVDPSTFSGQPIPRLATKDEVSKLVLFLIADATYSTGSEFIIDGGNVLGAAPLDMKG